MPLSSPPKRLQSALTKGPFVYAFVRPDLTVQLHNEPAAFWVGRPGEKMVGLKLGEIVPPETMETITPYLLDALAGTPQIHERSTLKEDGLRISVSHYVPEFEEEGQISGIHVYVFDITEQRASEEEARTQRERFKGAFDHSAIGMALVGTDGRFLTVNASLCEILGYSEQELLAGDFQTLTHPDDLEPDMAAVQRLLDGTAQSYTIEKRYISATGSVINAILSVSIVRDVDGKPLHFVSQIQDITARKHAEDRLYREHELAEVTLRSIGDGVITCDPDGRVLYLNPVAQGLTGWNNDDARGQLVSTVFDVRDRDGNRVPCPIVEALGGGRIVNLQANSILINREGAAIPVEDSAAPIRDRSGEVVGGVLVFHDVSHQRSMAVKLEFMAHHDMLTELPNRALFKERLESTITTSNADGTKCAILFCDLDRFKSVNDAYGHAAGDEVLKEVAQRLTRSVRAGDAVFRWAGDEFAVLLPHVKSDREARLVASRILENTREPMRLRSAPGQVDFSISIGIGIYPDDIHDDSNPEELVAAADTALYEVKRTGRNNFGFFHEGLNVLTRDRAQKEARLREALRTGSLELHYQPRVSLRDDTMRGVEALVRLRKDGELIYPDDFITIAEETGLIHELSRWVFREACRQRRLWLSKTAPDFRVAINLSALRLHQQDLAREMASVMMEYDLSPQHFELELTESILADANSATIGRIRALSEMGFKLSLDDFGTGFSNLSYLRSLPVDILKIDRSFVSLSNGDMTIANAIVGLGRSFRKSVVAEGVETTEQESALMAMGCDEGQGYLYSRPVPASEIDVMLTRRGAAVATPAPRSNKPSMHTVQRPPAPRS